MIRLLTSLLFPHDFVATDSIVTLQNDVHAASHDHEARRHGSELFRR